MVAEEEARMAVIEEEDEDALGIPRTRREHLPAKSGFGLQEMSSSVQETSH